MNIKTLSIAAVLAVSLIGGTASAWFGHHHVKPHKVERITTHTHVVHTKPAGVWHSHPKNPYSNDTYHQHPNGQNHHVHTYGKGRKQQHTHHGFTYSICPYPGH